MRDRTSEKEEIQREKKEEIEREKKEIEKNTRQTEK